MGVRRGQRAGWKSGSQDRAPPEAGVWEEPESSPQTSVLAPPSPSPPSGFKRFQFSLRQLSRSPVRRKYLVAGCYLEVCSFVLLKAQSRRNCSSCALVSSQVFVPPTVCSCAFRGIENISVIVVFFFFNCGKKYDWR